MSSNVTSTTKSTVSSIIKDNYLANGRELPTPDKSSLITSLNYNLSHLSGSQLNASANSANSSSSSGGGNGHLYQNVSNFKQIQNLLQQSNGGLKMNQPGQVPPVPSTPVPTTTPVAPSNGPVTNGHVATTTPASSQAVTVTATSTTPLTAKLSAMCKSKALDGYVGFANLPNQVYRKAVKKGFEFNLMVIGESGLGKSTFINSLFLTELYTSGGADSEWPGTFDRRGGVLRKTTCVESTSVTLVEKNVNLKLTVVDTPGYGESIDNTNCWQSIIDHIDSKYEDYLGAESKISRKLPINDQRVHCCLHFIAPGHTLKALDVEVMKRLHDRVNLIPVIAKADTMTTEEIKQFKANVLNVINENKLQIYEFPDIDDDDADNRTNNILKSKLPFAIVGSNTMIEVDGKQVRGRQYPWGVVNVDDLGHCDFMALRTMLIRSHMQDLKDVTNNVHYENYRFKKLAYVTGDKAKPTNKNPFQQLEDERREAEARLEKMKNEMEGVFDLKVKEKIARLKESEQNLEKQQEAMKMSLEKEERELEERRLIFLREKQQWEELNRDEEEKLRLTLEKDADKKKKKLF